MQKLFSGVQPSGNLHIGNYLGAVKQWVALQEQSESIFCVVDLHAITVPQDPETLRKKTLEIAKIYLASGIDPAKSTLFVQSHVAAHSELAWILNTIARGGELKRMTQFKDKAGIGDVNAILQAATESVDKYSDIRNNSEEVFFSEDIQEKVKKGEIDLIEYYRSIVTPTLLNFVEAADLMQKAAHEISAAFIEDKKSENVSVGLYDYPVLMAADILLYDTEVVPVGDDQLQHIELARTLARRFNERFGETFVVPEGRIQKEGARIMGLDDPTKKMSKSAPSEYNYISLTDDEETVLRKVKKAVTDSGTDITYSDDRPGLKNLINIYSLFGDKTPDEIVSLYEGQGYGAFKTGLASVISGFLTPFQERLAAISDEEVKAILEAGAVKARVQAEAKMKQVRERVGLL